MSLLATGAVGLFSRDQPSPLIANVSTSHHSTGPDSQQPQGDVTKIQTEINRMKVEYEEKGKWLAELEAALKAKDHTP